MWEPNATLTFKFPVSGGAVTRDPVTNAPIQQMQTVVVQASLEQVSSANLPQALPGVDETALYLEGRAVEPKYLTDAMKVQKTTDMTLKRGLNTVLKGKLYLLPNSSSRLGLDSYFGDFIAGYFQVAA